MTGSERDQSFPDSEPRDAATLMLIDRSDAANPKVLLGRRHAGHKFMPGKFVFPGGRIEAARPRNAGGKRIACRHAEEADDARRRTERGLTPAAFRSPPCARPARRPASCSASSASRRRRCRATSGPTSPRQHLPDLGQIHFIARAITPPRRPRRFDTRFFTADASHIAHRIDGIVGPNSELVELVWAPIVEAAKFDMPTITSVVLEELNARVAAGMAHDLPVPFYFMQDQQFCRELL